MHAQVERVTTRIIERSREGRAAYLARIDAMRRQGPARDVLGCANLAHGFAAAGRDKDALKTGRGPNVGIVTSYNDVLSAHAPFATYPDILKDEARQHGATITMEDAHPGQTPPGICFSVRFNAREAPVPEQHSAG